ncbi:MAG: NADP oxidoreductase [Synergistaceae bacterium]|nr:NADP oxidoreductase [Synergistaceae bacterium]
MSDKPKVATVWLESCAGCHMSFLDIDERIVNLLSQVELTASPVTDIKDIPEVTLGIIDGGIGNEEELHIAQELRKKCKILMVMGDCAVFGGINTMRNSLTPEQVLKGAYADGATPTTVNPSGKLPGEDIPKLLPQANAVDRYVNVDVYVPGCPPDADAIYYALSEILAGRIPVKIPADMTRYD